MGDRSERSNQIESELGTMFILDLMRQKREKLMRLKKDELINEAAKKQREKMQQVIINSKVKHIKCGKMSNWCHMLSGESWQLRQRRNRLPRGESDLARGGEEPHSATVEAQEQVKTLKKKRAQKNWREAAYLSSLFLYINKKEKTTHPTIVVIMIWGEILLFISNAAGFEDENKERNTCMVKVNIMIGSILCLRYCITHKFNDFSSSSSHFLTHLNPFFHILNLLTLPPLDIPKKSRLIYCTQYT